MVSTLALREPETLLALDRTGTKLQRTITVVLPGSTDATIIAQATEVVTEKGLDELAGLSYSQPQHYHQ